MILVKYIYLDESGNLGFKEKSGQYFIVAGLCVHEEKILNRCIKNVRRGLSKKYKKNELKFSNSSDITRRRVLECISRKDISISYLALKKEWIHNHLRDKPSVIHSYLIGQLLSNILYNAEVNKSYVIIDKFLNDRKIGGFNRYMYFKSPVKIEITHVASYGNNGIQAADFVAGAINRKYRDSNSYFYELIENKMDICLNSRLKIFKNKS